MRGIDTYGWHARVLPALITISPVAVWAVAAGFSASWRWGALAASSGALAVVAVVVRRIGRWRQPALVAYFGGDMPTTTALLLGAPTTNAVTKARRRKDLETLCGHLLPTAEQERADPQEARAVIEDAVRVLREAERAHPDVAPLVGKENRTYGLLRNTWALKPFGLSLAAVTMAAALVVGLTQGWQVQHVIGAGWSALACAAWLGVFTLAFIRHSAVDYAEHLLDAAGRLPQPTTG